jgi:Tfp pilus assembly protein PilN
MRPVNLVPKEYRRGKLAGRGGEVVSYAILGGLAAVLLAVVAIVLTDNQISDSKAELAKLTQKRDEAQAEAQALAPYASFAALSQARTATVSSLAQSRFDWDRVMHELATVLPPDVWLTQLTGTTSPETDVDNGASLQTRSSISGPALEIVGCGRNQDAVAGFVADLQDIDGVTRVGLESSKKPATTGGSANTATGSAGAATSGGSSDCSTRPSIPQFKIVVAFDAAPVPAGSTGSSGETTSPPAPSTPPTTPGTSGTGDTTQASEQQGVQNAQQNASNATNVIPGN